MNTKLKIVIAVLAVILICSLTLLGILRHYDGKKPAETTEPTETTVTDTTVDDTTADDTTVGDTTIDDTTASDTTVSDTTEPDTTEPDTTVPDTEPAPTETILWDSEGIKVWDDLTDQIDLLYGNKVQFKLTNNSGHSIVVTPMDVVVNGKEFAADESFDTVVADGSTVICTLTFEEDVTSTSFTLILSLIENDEFTDDIFTDTITITK